MRFNTIQCNYALVQSCYVYSATYSVVSTSIMVQNVHIDCIKI